jgi:hypothetical protein
MVAEGYPMVKARELWLKTHPLPHKLMHEQNCSSMSSAIGSTVLRRARAAANPVEIGAPRRCAAVELRQNNSAELLHDHWR